MKWETRAGITVLNLTTSGASIPLSSLSEQVMERDVIEVEVGT